MSKKEELLKQEKIQQFINVLTEIIKNELVKEVDDNFREEDVA